MIYLGSDHRGYEMKEKIKQWLKEQGREFEDCGPDHFDKDDDYPDFCGKVGEKVSADPEQSFGIVLGYSGQGEAIVANKSKHVRAIVYYGSKPEIVELGRLHNHANVLSLGAVFLSEQEAKAAIKTFLETKFLNEERHVRRVNKIKALES